MGVLIVRAYAQSASTTSDFERSGHIITNISNIQREVLLLRIETDQDMLESVGGLERVQLRRAFLTNQMKVFKAQAADSPVTLARLEEIQGGLEDYDAMLAGFTSGRTNVAYELDEVFSRLERDVKQLYDTEEIRFFRALAASLDVQHASQTLLVGVSATALTLGLALLFSLRRSVAGRFQKAYKALEQEVTERYRAEQALARKAQELATSNARLERRVKERTGELVNANEQLHMEVAERKEAEERVTASLAEKEVLLKEIHHRVKNNLQIISSLLNLQSRHAADGPAREMFKESRGRVKSMALIHEQLYESEDLARINSANYIQRLTADLFRSYKLNSNDVALSLNVSDVLLDVDAAIPCGLIINELVSNSLQHAFPAGRKGEICVDLNAIEHDELALTVSDNGVGLPESLDFRRSESLGLQLVNTLAEQLKGTIEHTSNHGAEFKVTFPRESDSATGPGKWSV